MTLTGEERRHDRRQTNCHQMTAAFLLGAANAGTGQPLAIIAG